jgi:hypothetical protein
MNNVKDNVFTRLSPPVDDSPVDAQPTDAPMVEASPLDAPLANAPKVDALIVPTAPQ